MHEDKIETERVDRRAMLRRAGVVVAGAAGATVAGAVAAAPAQANPGEPVLQGVANDAATSATSLTTNDLNGATFTVANSGFDSTADTGGASLRLMPNAAIVQPETAPGGSLTVTRDGYIMYAPQGLSGTVYPNQYLHSSWNSTFVAPVAPYRAVDTRSNRSRLFGSGALDSSGRLIGGKTVHLDLSALMTYAAAVFINVTTVGQVNPGFATVWPYGKPRPTASTINYQRNVAIANATLSGVGRDDVGHTDALSIYSNVTTHFIIDITGAVLFHEGSLYNSPLEPFANFGQDPGIKSQDAGEANAQAALQAKIAEWAKNRA
ncbi:MAG: hypothetical protein ACRDT4_17650 [Micromonosporaceae bacterium]